MEEQTMNQKLKPMIYIACLAAYNAGHLHGEWLDAAREPAEIQEDIHAILDSSPVESGGDYAIHDHEGFGDMDFQQILLRVATLHLARLQALGTVRRQLPLVRLHDDCSPFHVILE
jgi:antirestriction protein